MIRRGIARGGGKDVAIYSEARKVLFLGFLWCPRKKKALLLFLGFYGLRKKGHTPKFKLERKCIWSQMIPNGPLLAIKCFSYFIASFMPKIIWGFLKGFLGTRNDVCSKKEISVFFLRTSKHLTNLFVQTKVGHSRSRLLIPRFYFTPAGI